MAVIEILEAKDFPPQNQTPKKPKAEPKAKKVEAAPAEEAAVEDVVEDEADAADEEAVEAAPSDEAVAASEEPNAEEE
jgi:large subunit ribosomal protein L17